MADLAPRIGLADSTPLSLWERIGSRHRGALQEAATTARSEHAAVYLVGGAVRDLILGRPSPVDFDLTVVGDAVAVAESVARSWRQTAAKSTFGTAKLVHQGAIFDLVTARRERYRRPGALPDVEPASIQEDLQRRDFSIHALAFEIPPREGTTLLDPCGGLGDLQRGCVRVLHANSFVDDPTRILRAVRFELRLGFAMDEATLRRARAAAGAGALTTISSQRLREEFEHALIECEPLESLLRRWEETGVWRAVTGADLPARGDLARLEAWRRARARDAPSIEAAIGCVLDPAAAGCLAGVLGLPPQRAAAVAGNATQLRRLESDLRGAAPASDLARAWASVHPVVREFVEQTEDPLLRERSAVAAAATRIELAIDGRALIAHGATAGPELGAALRATLDARRDGEIGAEQELEFALARLAGEPAP